MVLGTATAGSAPCAGLDGISRATLQPQGLHTPIQGLRDRLGPVPIRTARRWLGIDHVVLADPATLDLPGWAVNLMDRLSVAVSPAP